MFVLLWFAFVCLFVGWLVGCSLLQDAKWCAFVLYFPVCYIQCESYRGLMVCCSCWKMVSPGCVRHPGANLIFVYRPSKARIYQMIIYNMYVRVSMSCAFKRCFHHFLSSESSLDVYIPESESVNI